MNISLENWIRNKLQENEEMHSYELSTEAVRCWIDDYNELNKPLVCPSCKSSHVYKPDKDSIKCYSCKFYGGHN